MKRSNKNDVAANRKSTALWAGLSFVLPAAVMLIILAAYGITPFGGSTIINESNTDWFNNFCRLYESVTEGENIFYRFNTGFASSFYVDFTSGLCTPFMFVALFFSTERLAAAYSIITVLRAAFSGLFAWIALNKISDASKPFSFVLACGYALCGFTACGIYCPSAADGAVFFPLLVLGIYVYVNESRPLKLFMFGTIFFITCSELFIIGIIISFVFYGLFYFRRGRKHRRVYKLAMFASMILCTSATAAVLIIPTCAAHYEGGFLQNISALFCGGEYDISTLFGENYLCIVGLLTMGVCCFMLNGKINIGERLCAALVMAIVLLSAAIRPFGAMLTGLGDKSSEPVSVGFIFVMTAIYCMVRSIDTGGMRPWHAVISAVLAVLSILPSALGSRDVIAIIADAGLTLVLAAVFFKLAYVRVRSSAQTSVIAAAILIFGAVNCCAAVSGMHSVRSADELASASLRRLTVKESISNSESSFGRTMGFYRVRSEDSTTANGMDLNKNRTSGFSEFANKLGITADGIAGGNENFTPLTDILFSVRYVVENDNMRLLDYAVTSPAYLLDASEDCILEGGNAFKFQNDVASKWFGVQNIFTPAEYIHDATVTSSANYRYKQIFGSDTASVEKYTVTIQEGEKLYMIAENTDYMFAVGNDSLSSWKKGCAGGIYALETQGDSGTVDVYISSDINSASANPIFMAMSDESVNKLSKSAYERGGKYISCRENTIKFMMNAANSQIAVTSIPYEYGWNITINGEKVDPIAVCGGLIGINLNAGSNSIVMEYEPPLFQISMMISALMFIMGAYITVCTEHENYRRRKVRMAFKAVELNLNRQELREYSDGDEYINVLSEDEENFYDDL